MNPGPVFRHNVHVDLPTQLAPS